MSSETVAGNYINLPDAPAVPGLKFRTFRGPEDYPALTAVNNGSKIADQIDNDLHTVETLTYVHTYAPNFDQYRDLFIAEVNGEMVGYQRVSWEKGVDGSRVYWHFAFILPEWRGKGIEQALLHAAERRAREIDAAANTGEPAELRCFDFETQTAHTAMILAEGYKPVRWNYEMETQDL